MNVGRIARMLYYISMNLFLIPFAAVLFIIKLIFNISFIKIDDLRIGHLAAQAEIFLRGINLKKKKDKIRYIGISSNKPCNRQLLEIFKRKICIIELPNPLFANIIFQTFSGNYSILNRWRLFKDLHFNRNEYFELNNGTPSLEFTEAEEKRGKEILKRMGLTEKDWFVCFHARDSAYLKKRFEADCSCHDHRDWDITSAIKSMEYITSKGGFAIRMGHIVEKRLPALNNPKIIDYANDYRTEFGDIYLPAKCKFFVGDGCGIDMIAMIFNRPLIFVNKVPSSHPPCSTCDLFIIKKLWFIDKKRFLTMKEILEPDISFAYSGEQYGGFKIKLVDNTPKEILDVVIEMNERLDRVWETTKKDEELQKKFKSLFKQTDYCYGFPSRIGTKFLMENNWLLGK